MHKEGKDINEILKMPMSWMIKAMETKELSDAEQERALDRMLDTL